MYVSAEEYADLSRSHAVPEEEQDKALEECGTGY